MLKRAAYLKRYISSLGVELPPDADEFKNGKLWAGECVFCQGPHNMNPVYIFTPVFKVRTDSNTYSCQDCATTIVQDLIRVSYPEIYREFYAGKVDFEPQDLGNKHYRINLFNTNDAFDETVSKFFIKAHQVNFKCYFCGNKTDADSSELRVPVDHTTPTLTGGTIKVCGSCLNDIWDKESPSNNFEQKCAYCVQKYEITHDEYIYRKEKDSLNKHMCPICTEEGITKEQFSSSVFSSVLADAINNSTPFHRFVYKTCSICSETLQIDLTLLHSRLKKIHTPEKGRHRCNTCYIFKVSSIDERFVAKVNDFYCVIFYLDKQWSYRISKVVNNEEKVYYRPASTYKNSNFLDALSDAVRGAMELHSSQFELDL